MTDMMPNDPPIASLGARVCVARGHINVGVVRDGDRALLIDFGDGSMIEPLRDDGIGRIDTVVFTHHHRDQVCGLLDFAGSVDRIAVPAAEARWFTDVASYWNDPAHRWHLYTFGPSRLMLAEPVRADMLLSDGDLPDWGPARITALATPGHTDGSLSYLVEIDGQRIVFCGDLIHSPGRIWEVWSMQSKFGVQDYHGFLGSRAELIESLNLIRSLRPDVLIPSHGEIMREPDAAIDVLTDRVQTCFDRYIATADIRFYFGEWLTEYPRDTFGMPFSPQAPVPEFLRHFGTTWALVSESGGAFLMDCGSEGALDGVRELISTGVATSIDGLWITHYHDDHVDFIPALQEEFDCECIADASVAEVVANPLAWRQPCISPAVVRVDRATRDGEWWQWREFKMTAYHFPGQTLYHGALLVEGRGLRLLFMGDSFAPSGMGDCCAQNRNFLGRGVGLDRCLRLVRDLKPDLMFNAHIDRPFTFTDEQCDYMLANLEERVRLYGELLPWEDPNFGMDESWVRCHPYEQRARPGEAVSIEAIVTNHCGSDQGCAARLVPPRSWGCLPAEWKSVTVEAGSQGAVRLALDIPPGLEPGRHVVTLSVRSAGLALPEFAEAIVVIT